MSKIINRLNQIGQIYIDESFHFIESESSIYTINGACLSDTIISKSNKVVNALKWLDLFWIYIEIYFVFHESKKKPNQKTNLNFLIYFFLLQFFKVLKKKRINIRFLELNGITMTLKQTIILNLIGTFIIAKI